MIHTERLASGALLLAEPVDRTDTLCIGFWFLYGSRDEEDGEHGFSHFLEHMLFKGTRARSAFQIAQEIDRVGGLINAFTEKETTCLYVILPREHVRLAFAVLSDMASDSLLDAGEMEKEKAVIVNEIGSVDDSPEEKGHEQYLRRMWGEHPLSRKITGEAAEVKAVDRDALAAFYASRFTPGNLVVAAAGNFDLEEVRGLAAEALAGRGGAGDAARAAGRPRGRPRRRPDTSFVADRFNQVQLYAGTSYPLDRELAHYYTSLVFSTAFGESMSSRLFQRLREEQALCYTVYSFRTFYSDVGQWTVYANATPAQTGKLLAALNAELARLVREPLDEREIDDARSHLVGSMIVAREDMESRMKRLVRQHSMIERVLEFDESVRMIRSISASDVERFVRAHVRSDAFNLLAYGSRGVARHAGFRFSF
ncbi:MAG: pitrilysin family protein [Spirochaetes bacterium]|nr:pitrilysin family protein [Spirochaetota bacterium]